MARNSEAMAITLEQIKLRLEKPKNKCRSHQSLYEELYEDDLALFLSATAPQRNARSEARFYSAIIASMIAVGLATVIFS